MNRRSLLSTLLLVLSISLANAQAPEGFNYQAVVRDAGNTILTNQAVGMRMTIQQGSVGGTAVYQETFAPTTNAYGLVDLEIGNGTPVSGTFATIDWSAGPYFIETAIDVTGGTSYTVMGTSELMSVPYALYSANGQSSGTTAGEMQYWNGSSWVAIPSGTDGQTLTLVDGLPVWQTPAGVGPPPPPAIGGLYLGGILAYVLQPGDPGYDAAVPHGLIAATIDQGIAEWGCYGTPIAGADGTALGTGNQNTIDIMNGCAEGGIAARLCGDLVLQGYSDWYLPSKDELNKLYLNIGQGSGLGNVGGFANSDYWSSTEGDTNYARLQGFNDGYQLANGKYYTFYVRAVRAF